MNLKMVADRPKMQISKDQTSLLKGIAIFLVLFDHIGENVGWLPSLPLGAVGVYMFLFLSGYGLMRSAITNGIAGYWMKRVKKVYLPYIVVLVFCAVLSLIFLHKIEFSFIKYFVLWKVPFGEYWYLRIQIEWYIAFFIIWMTKDKFNISLDRIPVLICIADFLIVTANIAVRNFAWTIGAFLLGGGLPFMVFRGYIDCEI